MKVSLYIPIIVISGLLASCHSAKKIQQRTAAKAKDTIAVVLTMPPDHSKSDSIEFINKMYSGVKSNRINVTTFSGKIDVNYKDLEGKDYNVNAHVRMYTDSAIWISITALLGIEGMRVFITSDSIQMLDKQEKIYTVKSIAYLQELTGLPLNLSVLQDLLLGNPVFLDSNIKSYSKSINTVSLLSIGSFFKNLFTINLEDKLVESSKLDDLDLQRNRTCILTYSDYENKKESRFSTKRSINISDKKKLNIKLNFKQYDFNEKLSFPFNVPKSYTQN